MANIFKYTIYEIPLLTTSSGPQYNFPVNNYMVGRKTFMMEMYTSSDIDRSPVSTGNLAWTPAQALAATITLYCFDPERPGDNSAKGEWIKQMPVNRLHTLWNTNSGTNGVSAFSAIQFPSPGHIIDWNSSFVTFTQSMAFGSNYSALFGVYYL